MQEIYRKTTETDIHLILDMKRHDPPSISIPVSFFAHLLYSMAWHGKFYLEIEASGDTDVDPHHLVEDLGIVLGQAFAGLFGEGQLARFGDSRIAMDDAFSEVIIDASNRPFLVYRAEYPQNLCGSFDVRLLREFFYALVHNARINLHALCHYGENSHHMAESLFKALGRALSVAFEVMEGEPSAMSTKGVL